MTHLKIILSLICLALEVRHYAESATQLIRYFIRPTDLEADPGRRAI
jgi:hypothetical protein